MAEALLAKSVRRIGKVLDRVLPVTYHSNAELSARLRRFGVQKVALLVDGHTQIERLEALLQDTTVALAGVYSCNLDVIGNDILSHRVQALRPELAVDAQGWIVSVVNELDPFALNEYLLQSEQEQQVILQHVVYRHGTTYYSYVDFFSGDVETLVHINNYFRRCYALPFPLDLRLTLRDCSGQVVRTGQVVIPPDALRVITSEEWALGDFKGYLEVEFEISQKVVPFLHYMVDYVCSSAISSSHQSGLGLHPAHSSFTRGFIPTEGEQSLEVCLFQKHYAQPVEVVGSLHYFQDGREVVETTTFPALHQQEMQLHDVKALFPDVDFSTTSSPYIEVHSTLPLHRPNYYYTSRGQRGYFDTSHAGGDPRHELNRAFGGVPCVLPETASRLRENGCAEMSLTHCLLPPELEIDCLVALGHDISAPMKGYTVEFRTADGQLVDSFEQCIDYDQERFINLNALLRSRGHNDIFGTCVLRPSARGSEVPVIISSVSGYQHRHHPYITSTAGARGQPTNLPFHSTGSASSYVGQPYVRGVTDVFGRGIASDLYDTYFVLSYPTADTRLRRAVEYELQVVNQAGRKQAFYRSIAPNGCDCIKLSSLLDQVPIDFRTGYYTAWFFCREAWLEAHHILYRRTDHAIALEHCYVGKFGL